MDEHILATVIRLHEAEAFVLVEPLHLAGDRNRRGWIGCDPPRRPWTVERALRGALGGARRIDLEHPVDLMAFEAVRDLVLQLGPSRRSLVDYEELAAQVR